MKEAEFKYLLAEHLRSALECLPEGPERHAFTAGYLMGLHSVAFSVQESLAFEGGNATPENVQELVTDILRESLEFCDDVRARPNRGEPRETKT